MTDTECCSPCGDTQLRPAAEFLAEYAAWLLGCGATCIRIEKNTRRMAERFGVEFDISIMPTPVVVSVEQKTLPTPVIVQNQLWKSCFGV